MKIGILGLGGIGGFIGVPLAKYYSEDENIKVIFICRGETKEAIKKKGLTLETQNGKNVGYPYLVSDDINEIGKLDILIIATKSYSLKEIISYKECITNNTIIILLQNMVNAKDVIRQSLPERGQLLEGCIYVASNVKAPGVVKHIGGPGKIFIGGEKKENYLWLLEFLQNAGIDVVFEEKIVEVLWIKYLFVAPVAAVTTAYNVSFGEINNDASLQRLLKCIMIELKSLAKKKGVNLSDNDIQTSLDLLNKFPHSAKSSLQLDFERNSIETEKPYLVDYIIKNCKKEGVNCYHWNVVNDKINYAQSKN